MSNTYIPRPTTEWKPHKNFVESKINFGGLHPILHAHIIKEREEIVAGIGHSKFPVTRLPAGTPTTYEEFQPKTQAINGKGGKGRKKEITKEEQNEMALKQFQSKEKSILSDSYTIELINDQEEPIAEEAAEAKVGK